MIVRGVRNGAAEEDWRWDLKPGVAAIPERGPQGFGGEETRENLEALAEKGERTTKLCQSGDPLAVTELMGA